MKENKHIQSFNKHQEKLNISDVIMSKLEKLSKEDVSKIYVDLIKNLERCANTYEKMYYDGEKTLDTYSYVGVFRNIINRTNKSIDTF
jgi:translation initiation factor 2 alpha subunit (eIF-2alpha)